MFKEVEGGSIIEIPDNAFGFVYKCWLPPVGYGVNVITGKLEETDVFKRSDDSSEQYWERHDLPSDYKDKRKKEAERQRIDKDYIDPSLEEIRAREWRRRLCGVWFWNNGKCEYITGLHYFYLNWWKFQGKYNDYRRPDRDSKYVTAYCIEDPCCLGLNEIMNRKSGKTARAGCVLYERTSRMENHHGGIQSKTDTDAWEVFKKAVVYPWRKLPHFYRPIYDLMKGDDPNDELRFFATSRRGANAESDNDGDAALESFIDYKSSDEAAYDGPELHTYVSDETSKTKKDVSIKERQNVTRFCTEIGGEIKGFHYYTTTVEIEDGEEDNHEFQEMTAMSNPLDKDENGRTMTGLYTYFRPAYQSLFFDKYGEPDEERAKAFLLNTREKLEKEGKLRALSSFKRKQPMNFREAFSTDGKNSLFNPELINMQMDEISFRKDLTEFGDLEWVNGEEFVIEKEVNGSKVLVPNGLYWVPNPNGEFERVKDWWPKEPNKVFENNGKYLPNNNHSFRIGGDPFKYDKTKSKRRSNCAAFSYQIADPIYPSVYDEMPVLKYSKRPESARLAHYALMKMAWLCGCEVLLERNFNKWKDHFTDWNCEGFLMWLPGEVEPGIYTDGKGTVVQTICNYTESYINENIKKVFFKSLMQKDGGWLGFKVEDTQESDEPMGFGFTLIAVKGKKYIRREEREKNVEDVLPYRKAG